MMDIVLVFYGAHSHHANLFRGHHVRSRKSPNIYRKVVHTVLSLNNQGKAMPPFVAVQ